MGGVVIIRFDYDVTGDGGVTVFHWPAISAPRMCLGAALAKKVRKMNDDLHAIANSGLSDYHQTQLRELAYSGDKHIAERIIKRLKLSTSRWREYKRIMGELPPAKPSERFKKAQRKKAVRRCWIWRAIRWKRRIDYVFEYWL